MKPLISLQILRAVAAWLVVYSHFMQLVPTGRLIDNGWGNYGWLGFFGVDLFFVISGFIMFHSINNNGYRASEFFINRLIRIVPAYWFFTFAMALLCLFFANEFSYTGWNWKSLFESLFFLDTDNPSGIGGYPLLTVGWTLSFEMFFYVLLSLSLLLFGRYCFLTSAFILIMLPHIWNDHWFLGYIASQKLLYEFVYGLALGFAYTRFKHIPPHLLYPLGIGLFALAMLFVAVIHPFAGNVYSGGNDSRPMLAFLLIGSVLCFEPTLSQIKLRVFGWMKHLGDISYSTYLLHTLVIGVFMHFIGDPNSALAELVILLGITLSIILLSHLSFRHIETGPAVSSLKKTLAIQKSASTQTSG